MTKALSRRSFLRTSLAGSAAVAASPMSFAAGGIYIHGTYSAKANGIGEVIVTMTFDSNKITDVV